MDYLTVSLYAKLKEINGDKSRLIKLRESLSLFKCEKNEDEQDFIHNKAIDFETHNKARTYLLINNNNKIIAYFSIAFKSLDLVEMSTSEKKNITGGTNTTTYSSFLIGHLAKDDSVNEKMMPILLDGALKFIYEAQRIVGGRLVYLDCKDEPKLIEMYEKAGFKYFKTDNDNNLRKYYMKL